MLAGNCCPANILETGEVLFMKDQIIRQLHCLDARIARALPR